MERVNRIWNHPVYQEHLRRTVEAEKNRMFCRHTPEHFLDTARLCYIFCLEAGISVDKELIYAAALLHDVGRYRQYEEGIPHEKASLAIAVSLLPECGFTEEETARIADAIDGHRKPADAVDFRSLFYRADKASRSCYLCEAEPLCDWSPEKKNMSIEY